VESRISFRYCAFDSYSAPPGAALDPTIEFFNSATRSPSDARVTDATEKDIIDWLVQTKVARELLLQELQLPTDAYTQTGITEPLLDNGRHRPPGDIDLIFVPEVQRAVAIQVKRVRGDCRDYR
jgi:hypothetical protein